MTPGVLALGGLGLLVGSFLNVCIVRLPERKSLMWPASHCMACGRALRWYENIPVASWLALRGRCRTCHAPISARYPVVEIVTALIFAGTYAAFGWQPLLAVRLVFASALIVLFAIDLEHFILPNPITLPGIAVGFAASFLAGPGWRLSLAGLVAGGLFPWLVAWGYLKIRGKEGMGMGDFKMLAMVGAFLGWPLVALVLILACVLGIAIGGGGLLLSRRAVMDTKLPFGTFIAVSALVCSLWERRMLDGWEQVVTWYLRVAGLA